MKRKPPIRHHVRSHYRTVDGKRVPVTDYIRGKGQPKPKIANPRLRTHSPQNFHVIIQYHTTSESIPVQASNFPEAVDIAMLSRYGVDDPSMIEVTKL